MAAVRHRVLIVDDDPVLLELISLIMQQLSEGRWEVLTAASTEAALALLQHQPPDLILADVCMPGTGGLAFIREVHERHPRVLIAAISGDAPPGREEACRRQGASLFLEKPRSGDGWVAIHAILQEQLRMHEEAPPADEGAGFPP